MTGVQTCALQIYQKVGLSDGGILLQYNLNSTPHKFFDITPSGVSWTNGTTTLTTSLDRLAAVETAFTSIELPPNTSTLKVNNTIQLENIPISLVDKIEILRGNASALYGPGAAGGVIQIFTKSGASRGFYGSISYGSRNTQNYLFGYGEKFNDTTFNISLNRQQTDGFATLNPSQNYTFSYWIQSLTNTNTASIDVKINGTSIGIGAAPLVATCGNWTQ